jgi:phage-related protein (TIGR01555 family)
VALDAVQGATGVVQAVAALVQESKIDVIKIPDLSQNLASEDYAKELISRFQLANTAKSLINTLMLDKEEEWNRITADMAGMPDILKMFLLMVSGAADIPATRMLGQSPVGLNATGDGDLRNYYDRIHSDQNNTLSPALATLDDVLLASALGSRNPSIYYEWNNLWQMSEEEKANLAILKAKTYQIDAMVGLVDQEALRIGRQNQLIEDGVYPGIEEALEEQDQLGLDSMISQEEQQAAEAAQVATLAQAGAAAGTGPGAPGPKAPPIKGPNKSPATRDSKKKIRGL